MHHTSTSKAKAKKKQQQPDVQDKYNTSASKENIPPPTTPLNKMKFQINLLAVLLAATTFASPSAAARLKHLREGEGDLKLKKPMDDELGDRRLADDIDVASMMAELNSVPEIALLHEKRKAKDSPSPPPCYIGDEFLNRKLGNEVYDPDPNVICCDMPPSYYDTLEYKYEIIKNLLTQAGCPPVTKRPACYSTGTQISFWQLQSRADPDDVTDYPVCPGVVISPGEDFFDASGVDASVLGFLDSPVFVSIPGLTLTCPTKDCAFNGGQIQILANGVDPYQDWIVEDISGLLIEGFTFTGTMPMQFMSPFLPFSAASIAILTNGSGISIEDNVFKDISHNVLEDKIEFGECGHHLGYVAVIAMDYSEGYYSIGQQVTIENNVFENIDTGTYPVYANNPKDCNFCYEETKTKYPIASLIKNFGQEVNLVDNTFKNVVAQDLYSAREFGGEPVQYQYNATISGNVFHKNSVHALLTLVDPDPLGVSIVGNEGECKQKYTGGAYCPVRMYEYGDFQYGSGSWPHYESCDGSSFCYTEKRASQNTWIDEPVCHSF